MCDYRPHSAAIMSAILTRLTSYSTFVCSLPAFGVAANFFAPASRKFRYSVVVSRCVVSLACLPIASGIFVTIRLETWW